MARSTSILVLRHGESTWNAAQRWQGWKDAPLSSLGEQQARDAVANLRDAGIEGVASSDLQRAHRSALLIAEGLGIGTVVIEPDLRERNMGAFEGNTTAENLGRWPELFDGNGRLIAAPPDAEPIDSFIERTVGALLRLAHLWEGRRALVVSHGGVVRALDRHLGVQPPPRTANLSGRWFDVCPGGAITAGDLVVPIEPEHVSAPTSE